MPAFIGGQFFAFSNFAKKWGGAYCLSRFKQVRGYFLCLLNVFFYKQIRKTGCVLDLQFQISEGVNMFSSISTKGGETYGNENHAKAVEEEQRTYQKALL